MPEMLSPKDKLRADVLRRFRNFAIFWIAILVIYFVGADAVVTFFGVSISTVLPTLVLLAGVIIIASIWHAAAIGHMINRDLL